MKNLTRLLAPATALLLMTGCFDDDKKSEKRQPIDSAKLVSASGSFTLTKGELEVSVSPRDAAGNFIGVGLGEERFSFENVTIKRQGGSTTAMMPQDVVTTVTGIEVREPVDNGSLTSVVVFDSSGSMSSNDPRKEGRLAGGAAIFDQVSSDDELAVLDFGAGKDNMLKQSRLLQDFTNDRALLDAALGKLVNSGGTPLYGSLLDALGVLAKKREKGGSIIVLTDGQSSGDSAKVDDVITAAKAQQVPVYAIGLGEDLSFDELARLGSETGGALATASQASSLGDAFDGIGIGVQSGRVIVHGEGTYAALTLGTIYKVEGDLVTDDPASDELVVTPFEFLVKATKAGMEPVRTINNPNL